MGQHGALAGIEQRAVLEQAHRFGHGVERAAALGQHTLAGQQHLLQRGGVFAFTVGIHGGTGNRAGATVDGNDSLGHDSFHSVDSEDFEAPRSRWPAPGAS
ncbi:hypothetical protein D3C86_1866970 [compost metagenome]